MVQQIIMQIYKVGYWMSKLELMKKETERHKVLGAKMEYELKILEREQDIVRLRENILNNKKE